MSDYKLRSEKEKENTAEDKNKSIAVEDKNTATDAVNEISLNPEEDVEEVVIEFEDEGVDNIVKLSKKYKFEGKIIEEIDLTGIQDVSGETAQNVEKLYRKTTKTPAASPEITIDYAMAMASTLTGLPIEFFKKLNIKDVVKMKNRIVNFLYED